MDQTFQAKAAEFSALATKRYGCRQDNVSHRKSHTRGSNSSRASVGGEVALGVSHDSYSTGVCAEKNVNPERRSEKQPELRFRCRWLPSLRLRRCMVRAQLLVSGVSLLPKRMSIRSGVFPKTGIKPDSDGSVERWGRGSYQGIFSQLKTPW